MAFSPTVKTSFWAGAFLLFIAFIWLFNSILTPFILGIAIAYLLDPIVRKLAKEKGVPRWVISLVILSLFILFLLVLVVALAPMVFQQLQMLAKEVPNYIQSGVNYLRPYLSWIEGHLGRNYLEELNAQLKGNAGTLVGSAGNVVAGIASGGFALMSFFTMLVLTPLVAFFMMNEWPKIVKWVESLYPRQHEETIRNLLKQIDTKISGFIRGQITVAFILGIVYAVSLSIAGLNYGFLIGLGSGLFSIIPFVGSTLGLIVSVGVAWFQTGGDWTYTAIIAAIFLSGQFIEGNFLTPKLVGDSVGLHPLWVLFALMAGGSLFGIVGMLLAVPVAAVIGVLLGFVIGQYKASPLYRKPVDDKAIILEDHPHD